MAHDTTLLAHFYRASMLHADVWRQRLDATTNWAVITTAAVITFAFGEAQAPHFIVLMGLVFTAFFLLMESRRYQIYHVWEVRLRLLHRYVVAPALRGEAVGETARLESTGTDEDIDARGISADKGLAEIASHLGSTLPRISLIQAVGYRIRRNYGPLFTLVLLAWGLKLWSSPEPVTSFDAFVARAAVGVVPGAWIILGALAFFVLSVLVALAAPSEHLVDWSEEASPAGKLMGHARGGSLIPRKD